MSWTLEASFALAALILTLLLSGLGLALKYWKGTSPLGKGTLLQMFVEGTFTLIACAVTHLTRSQILRTVFDTISSSGWI